MAKTANSTIQIITAAYLGGPIRMPGRGVHIDFDPGHLHLRPGAGLRPGSRDGHERYRKEAYRIEAERDASS